MMGTFEVLYNTAQLYNKVVKNLSCLVVKKKRDREKSQENMIHEDPLSGYCRRREKF